MFNQHYLDEGILFNPPVEFGRKYSYRTRCPPWFAEIPHYKKCFSQHFLDTRIQYGGIHYHLIYLMLLPAFA